MYAGSGRTYEGLFKDDRVAGLSEAELATERYAIKGDVAEAIFAKTGLLPTCR